jgi:hypothetical protein
VAKLILSPDLIIINSSGKSFTFDKSLGAWLCLSDTSSSIQNCSSYATASTNLPPDTKNMPLASLGYLTPKQPPRLHTQVPDETKALATITHCRNQRLAAEYLNSPKEYQYWFLAEIRHLAAQTNVPALRSNFDWLMGPVHSSSALAAASNQTETILGILKKHDLLKAGLGAIKGNLQLQRLYAEYYDQLNSVNDVCDIDKMLQV